MSLSLSGVGDCRLNTAERFEFSKRRIEELQKALAASSPISESGVCVYATGSFGRFEAHRSSDLDIFLIADRSKEAPLSRSDELVILGDIVTICRQQSFRDFDQGGSLLHVHDLADMSKYLGSATDDSANHFTARMLLLLESHCLSGEAQYQTAKSTLLELYFRDYDGHAPEFLPVFLINDILRYWRTLCLNFEYSRVQREEKLRLKNRHVPDTEVAKIASSKAKLKNFKLKFSRILTCFSMIAPLVSLPGPVNQALVLQISNMRLFERLDEVNRVTQKGTTELVTLKSEYDWFLSVSALSETDLENWVSKTENWIEIREHASRFREALIAMISVCKKSDSTLSYLFV